MCFVLDTSKLYDIVIKRFFMFLKIIPHLYLDYGVITF